MWSLVLLCLFNRLLTLSNNYLADNAAGIWVNTTTKDSAVALYANVTNNVILRCTHGEALHFEGNLSAVNPTTRCLPYINFVLVPHNHDFHTQVYIPYCSSSTDK